MRPTKAKDHHAAGVPCGPPSVSWQAPVPVEETQVNASPESDQGPLQDGAGVCSPADPAGVYAVDADVPAAVGRVLGQLLSERRTQAVTLDPMFAGDLADRVARFTLEGGKRTRSQLVWWALRACGGTMRHAEATLRVGAALEIIQTCALIHDDVMDASRLRRGRPSLHADVQAQYAGSTTTEQVARFGEATAILAGDLALAWADDVLTETDLPPDTRDQVRGLWRAMRMEMVAGQYLDLHGQITSSRSLTHAIRAACLKSALYSVERPLGLGAALAGADAATTTALCSAGRCFGIAFQLRDDLHDVFGGPQHTGKPSGGDIRSGKPTYLMAVAQARVEAVGDRHALAVLKSSLGCAELSEADLTAVRRVLVTTGAQKTVEAKIDRLVAQGIRHFDSVLLEPEGGRRLRALLLHAAGAPHVPSPSSYPSEAEDGLPVPLLLTAAGEGRTR
ncbi:polyprenyl synthetase family protein [Streptomyces triticiradicis]|uniref:Polyprenyl synthetase family protein n=1 Tax=Streptomyces triticiradicis TaxID=2651189 RepID=A0A7J5D1C4_9ACTN|nr:polyprenyl synthetase family protein [Streptomyces triticiradicis]KAB1976674.1 polyprenyl synthetase family protein [Streptomyces triticiradicis]